MKRIITLISLAALMMPVSCTKDELAGPDQDNAMKNVVEFTAVMEGAASKTTLDTETGKVAWKAGDAIKFDYEIQKADSEPVVSSSLTDEDINDGVATFRAEVPAVFSMTDAEYKATLEEGVTAFRHLYVVYPASIVTEYVNSGYTVTIPAEQDGKFESASISLAKWNINKPNDPLDFRNLCGLLQVKVADENVRQIKVSSSNYIAGRANVGFASKVPFDPYVKDMYEEGSSKTITVNVDGEGTYYIAVAPGTLTEFYVELLGEADADGNRSALGDRLAKSEITVERAHVLPLGTLGAGSFAGEGGFFVKPEAAGSCDGSSWDNAADYSAFLNKLTGATIETVTVYMAGGTYVVTGVANVSKAQNYTVYGGYPADAKGYSLTGRDVENNPTVLKSDGASHRFWNFKYGTYVVDGIHFEDASYSDGGALNIQLSTNITCRNCVFKNCLATKNGGAVKFDALTSTGSIFENCIFSGNTSDGTSDGGGFGGAVGCFGTAGATVGLVTFKKCLFEGNEAKYAGGAVASRITSMHFIDCNFIDNIGGPSTDHVERSSTLFTDATIDLSLYCDGCYFANSNAINNVNTSIIANHSEMENVTVCLNNSVVSGYWGYGNTFSVANTGLGKIVVSNSTLLGQSGATIYNKDKGSVSVINSIVGNASSGMISCKADDGTFTLKNSLCTKTAISTATDCALNINVRTNAAATVKFPTDDTPWVHGAANYMREDNGTKTTKVDDCRGKVYYYDWDGTYPEGVTFTPTTMEIVNGLILAADKDFYDWLTANGSLNKDIRGEVRTDPTWPGSYQE